MPTPSLADRILESIIFDGPATLEQLEERLIIPLPLLRSAIWNMSRDGRIEVRPSGEYVVPS